MQQTKPVTLEVNGNWIDAELTFNYTQFEPGFYSGKPEDCYPCQPEEFDLIKLVAEGENDCTWLIPYIFDDLISQLKAES